MSTQAKGEIKSHLYLYIIIPQYNSVFVYTSLSISIYIFAYILYGDRPTSARYWLPHWLCPQFVSYPIALFVDFATLFQVEGIAHLLHPLDVEQGGRGMMMEAALPLTQCAAFFPPLHGHAPDLTNINTSALKSLQLTCVGFLLPVQNDWKNCIKS